MSDQAATQGAATGAPSAAPAPGTQSGVLTVNTPGQAQQERAGLMASAEFRAAAMNPKSAEWVKLTSLDRAIAEGKETEAGTPAQGAQRSANPAAASAAPDEEGHVPPEALQPPPTHHGYQFPRADRMGVETDFAAELDLKQALHGAGIDTNLASALYTAALNDAAKPLTPVEYEGARIRAEQALQREWKGQYAERIGMAREYARELYSRLPESTTKGMSFEEFALQTGLGDSAPVIRELYTRAAARSSKEK